jgi:transcription elongation factor Elf1
MDYILYIIIFIVVVSLFSKDSKNKFHCSNCGKKCSHTFIETLEGYNRYSDYYTCDCCGERFTNDRFFK